MQVVSFTAIGHAETQYTELANMPIQAARSPIIKGFW